MIDTSPNVLARLVSRAESERDRRMEATDERAQTMMGSMSMGDEHSARKESPENLAFGLYSILLPSMVTSSPVFQVRSEGGYEERLQAAAIGTSGTQIAKKTRLAQVLEPAAWDFVVRPYCAAFIEKPRANMRDLTADERAEMAGRLFAEEPDDVGGEDGDVKAPRATDADRTQIPARWPQAKRLDPKRCGFSVRKGGTLAEMDFSFYRVVANRDELQKRADEHSDDWYPDAVASLEQYGDADRNEVEYAVVYVPGGTIDGETPGPTQPGTIHTIATFSSQAGGAMQSSTQRIEGRELRRPFYYEGHPGGPIVFEGQYTTGEDAFFLGILSANEDAIAMLDAVAASLHSRIENHKTVFAYDQANEAQVEKVINAKDGEFVSVPGLNEGNGAIHSIETSPVSPAEVNEYREVQMNASRQVGIDDSGRGLANKDATATAVSVAANTTRTKVQYLLARWTRFVREIMERIAWEIAHDDRVAIRLDEEGRAEVLRAQLEPFVQQGMLTPEGLDSVIEDMKREPVLYQGGDFANEDGELDWHSLAIDIQPNSLDGTFGETALAREATWNEQLAFLGQQMVAQPHIDWASRIAKTARALGMTDGDSIADKRVAEQITQIQLAQGAMGAPMLASESPNVQRQGATLRESSGGASSPAGVDPGGFNAA